ncbi:GumC family protein [Sphaerotilus mobilis]|uniref:Uncharacterized protein involved in exopolysaccharide biosynthesis n=1 Tax=Sphaerotilus mobilis TaxID=47994 RepID=A0A4Q7LBE5_9BURK|nr:Wzz/FepE/Etk N-terminal domain-containing protein [Sphaerotilus mobilis]RZS47477.1 uncharacterized protein involved in exopolysaccharide biosynthesis [Sphaerotilus mobilis]
MSGNQAITILDIFKILRKRWLFVVFGPLIIGVSALGFSFMITPKYTASAQIMIPQTQSTASALLGSLGGLAGAAGGAIPGLKNPADQWIGLMRSRTVGDALVDRFSLLDRYKRVHRFEAREQLSIQTSISSGKDSLIDISVEDVDPKVAAEMTTAYIEELQKLSKSLAVSEAAQRRLFFQKQLEEAKEQLLAAELALQRGGVSEQALMASPETAVGTVARLKAQITAAEVQISVMSGSMTENNALLQASRRELDSLRAQLARVDRPTSSSGASKDIRANEASGDAYIARLRNFKYYETLFELMARQYELARADEAKDGALIQVVDPAQIPEWKSSPKRGIIAVMSTLSGLIACVAAVLIWHQYKESRRVSAG